MQSTPSDQLPWYRQFWPWFLMAPPAVAVLVGISFFLVAAHDPDGLVEDDYYKVGLGINQDLGKAQRAAELGLTATIQVEKEGDGRYLSVRFTHHLGSLPPGLLQVRMLHPTRAHQDATLLLEKEGEGVYRTPLLPEIKPGNWHVLLEPADQHWRLQGRLKLPTATEADLSPARVGG